MPNGVPPRDSPGFQVSWWDSLHSFHPTLLVNRRGAWPGVGSTTDQLVHHTRGGRTALFGQHVRNAWLVLLPTTREGRRHQYRQLFGGAGGADEAPLFSA